MPNKIELKGRTFSRLKVINQSIKTDKYGAIYWKCKCVCGEICHINGNSLRSGKTRSCGCLQIDAAKKNFTKHGLVSTPEMKCYLHMKSRCYNKNNPSFKYYGGRGIIMCSRWLKSFNNFYTDMGLRPSLKHSIDRIEVNGNYEPQNCRWATHEQIQMACYFS